jgi:hypothetical protein
MSHTVPKDYSEFQILQRMQQVQLNLCEIWSKLGKLQNRHPKYTCWKSANIFKSFLYSNINFASQSLRQSEDSVSQTHDCGHLLTSLVGGQTSRMYSSNTGQYMCSACI